ncbi:MAG: lipid-A-disaccharide synthase [bacterium]|nr:lipid-A-disaccharide synthase [bacterium]
MGTKLLIVTGETSGDLHAGKVVKELKLLIPDIKISGIGGEKLKGEGVNLLYDIKELAVMGFLEIIPKFFKIKNALNLIYKHLLEEKPDLCVLVDYPGFNLKVARFAKKQGIKVVYYILPQVWAWGKGRIKIIEKYVDKGIVILPFEQQIYKNLDTKFFGHPLVDTLQNYIPKNTGETSWSQHKIALLPGSRKDEIRHILPIMLNCVKLLPEYEFVMPVASGIDKIWLQSMIKNYLPADKHNKIIFSYNTYETLKNVSFALVKSGTSTLETCIMKVPMVIIYKTSAFSYFISRLLVKTKWIGLPNLIAGRQIVPEFIQYNANPEKIVNSMKDVLQNRNELIREFEEIISLLAVLPNKQVSSGVATKVANFIAQEL